MPWICGVEEAGRGPVIGPMVMAVCWVQEKDEKILAASGATDSKQLSPKQREQVLENLQGLKKKGIIGFERIILSPQEIDAAVEDEVDNLNHLELRTSAQLINKALKQQAIAKALIDCPTKNTEKYATGITQLLKKGASVEVVAEHKADENYVVVGAASIVAKVTRDAEIAAIKKRLGQDIGSGYPADPATQAFLRENFTEKKYKDIFRKSWGTYKALVERSKQSSLSRFGAEPEDDEKKVTERAKELKHAAEIKRFEALTARGYDFIPPKTPYEVVRMKGPGATIIKYTTGKLVVQGAKAAKETTEELLKKLKLL